jgi:hypothetical protein
MINRRILIASALSALAGPLPGRKASAQGAMTKITAYAFSFPDRQRVHAGVIGPCGLVAPCPKDGWSFRI